MPDRSDVAVVIRATDERTLSLCHAILARQVAVSEIKVVGGGPFAQTLSQSYLAGIEAGCTWTLCIDADVLPTPGCVQTLIDRAISLDRPVFEVQGLVLDKIFGVCRPAGNHLYRTALLPQALPLIPMDETVLRPETTVMAAMSKKGHPWWQDDAVVGLHDFGQWHRDIIRKVFVQAAKFQRHLSFLRDRFQSSAAIDTDFQAALEALSFIAGSDMRPVLDSARLANTVTTVLQSLGLPEKPPLSEVETVYLLALAEDEQKRNRQDRETSRFAHPPGYY